MITDEQRAAWQALADAATDGPWEADERTGNVSTRRGRVADDATEADAEFIAAAREAVPALLAALRETEAERDALARQVEAVRALHTQDDHGPGRCDDPACEAWCREDSMDWPCPTIRALDGEDGADPIADSPPERARHRKTDDWAQFLDNVATQPLDIARSKHDPKETP